MGVPAWVDSNEYPFTPKRARLRRGTMSYVDVGSGPPIVFVHGTPTWSFEFRKVIGAMQEGYRCIAPDHLGFGLSDRPDEFDYSVAGHADNLEEFLGGLGLDRFTLYVHDYGGPIGLRYAERHPEKIDRLVVSNTFMWPLTDPHFARAGKMMGGAVGRFLYYRMNFSLRVMMTMPWANRRLLTRALHRQYLEPFKEVPSRRPLWTLAREIVTGAAVYEELWNNRATLADKPALIVWGMKDTAFRPEELERLKSALPQAEVLALQHAGHFPQEEAPDEIVHALKRFVPRGQGRATTP